MSGKVVGFRAPCMIRQALERASRRETRSLAHQALRYVREGLVRDGYLPADIDLIETAAADERRAA